jgi:hypothetical protein
LTEAQVWLYQISRPYRGEIGSKKKRKRKSRRKRKDAEKQATKHITPTRAYSDLMVKDRIASTSPFDTF